MPLADAGRQMRRAAHDDIALESLPLAHVVRYRDAARRLHRAMETAAGPVCKLEHPESQAAVCQGGILRTIMTVHPLAVVARRRLVVSRRGLWIVLPTAAGRVLGHASVGRLQQHKTKFTV